MSEAKIATLVSALSPDVRKIAEAVKTAATAFGKARDNLSTALYNLAKTDAHTRAGLPFKVFGPRLAAEMGFEVSPTHCTNAVVIGSAKAACPVECKGLGDTVILRSAEAIGGTEDAEDLAAFLSEVKAAGGRVDDVKAVKAARKGGSAKVDRESIAIRNAAEAIGKVWRDDALGQTAALASVARALGLNAVADTIMMGRDAIAAEAVRKALAKAEPEAVRKAARPNAETVAAAAARMAEADAKAERKAIEAAERAEEAAAELAIAKGRKARKAK
jgi:hypothetical protein